MNPGPLALAEQLALETGQNNRSGPESSYQHLSRSG